MEKGALYIHHNHLQLDYALGDFDSVTPAEKDEIRKQALYFQSYPSEKDRTDLEIAIDKAVSLKPKKIYLFGTTGGRKDHELVNIQLLYRIADLGMEAAMIDRYNFITLKFPGEYTISHDRRYSYISFIAFTPKVSGITLTGFKYELKKESLSWGSTLCISNQLLGNTGTFSYDNGILLLIKSRETVSDAIQK